uniref:Rab-GAP TBC domain-containing protein n=1 Tax=Gongylonema pulchrum TaxID=637853 RepID=A0A183DE51_9BILA
LRFESIKVDHFLRCCVLLRLFINKERSTAADLQWMTLQQALEVPLLRFYFPDYRNLIIHTTVVLLRDMAFK